MLLVGEQRREEKSTTINMSSTKAGKSRKEVSLWSSGIDFANFIYIYSVLFGHMNKYSQPSQCLIVTVLVGNAGVLIARIFITPITKGPNFARFRFLMPSNQTATIHFLFVVVAKDPLLVVLFFG